MWNQKISDSKMQRVELLGAGERNNWGNLDERVQFSGTQDEDILKNSSMAWRLQAISHCGSAVMNLTSIHEDSGSIPGPAQ